MKLLLRHNSSTHEYMENYIIPFIMDILKYVRQLDTEGRWFEYRAWLCYYIGWANLQLNKVEVHDEILRKAVQEIETHCVHGDYKELEVYQLCK